MIWQAGCRGARLWPVNLLRLHGQSLPRFILRCEAGVHGLGKLCTRKNWEAELTFVATVLVVGAPRFCQPLVVKLVLDWSW